MSTRKTLVLASLALITFPLPRTELFSRVADDCTCDRTKMACRILCSGIGSGPGTGGGSSSFRLPPEDRPAQERPVIVPRIETDIRSPAGQIK